MISVVLSYSTGATREVLLAGVPRVGEQIRLDDAEPNEESLLVDHVLWTEGGKNGAPKPKVILVVHEMDRPPRRRP